MISRRGGWGCLVVTVDNGGTRLVLVLVLVLVLSLGFLHSGSLSVSRNHAAMPGGGLVSSILSSLMIRVVICEEAML